MTQQFQSQVSTQEKWKHTYNKCYTPMFIAALFASAKKSNNLWMDKPNVVYPCKGISFSHKKERFANTCYNMEEPWKHEAKWKKTDTQDQVLYDSIYMKCSE